MKASRRCRRDTRFARYQRPLAALRQVSRVTLMYPTVIKRKTAPFAPDVLTNEQERCQKNTGIKRAMVQHT